MARMPHLTFIRPLYEHMEWADSLVWEKVFATPAAMDDQKLRTLLHHIHMVQRAFLTIWRSDEFKYHELSEPRDLQALAVWCREGHAAIRSYLDDVDATTLDAELKMPWADRLVADLGRSAAPTTLGETMLQVPMHSLYHRGQVNARLRELGGEPPLVDYIAWLWLGRPAPAWQG